MVRRLSQNTNARRIMLYAGLCAALVAVLSPVYLLVKYSVSDAASINTGGEPIPLWPYEPNFRTFAYLFSDSEFFGVIGSSLVIALATVAMSLFLGVPAAYVLARYRVPGRKVFMLGLISVRLFPDISSVIPVTEFFIKLDGQNTYWAIVFAHTLLSLPYVIFIAISAFESIPHELEEQARVMGASRLQTFYAVLVPLALPGILASAIYTFLLSWDEFIFAYFILGLGRISTLTLYLNQKMSFAPPQNILATISVCLSLPVVGFALMLQKYMTAGITSGSVK